MKQGLNVGDEFVIAWGWDVISNYLADRRTQTMLDGVINILGNPALDDEYTLQPSQNAPFASAFQYHSPQQKQTLLAALSSLESGNFFWFGHGSSSGIAGDEKVSSIGSAEVEQALGNLKARSKPGKPSYRNNHPYRLVILNGCDTYSPDWARAFGVDFSPGGTTNDVVAYVRQGRQPQAYVGWTGTVEVPGAAGIPLYHSRYSEGLGYLFSAWMAGYALEECLRQYETIMAINAFPGHSSWKISGSALLYRGAR